MGPAAMEGRGQKQKWQRKKSCNVGPAIASANPTALELLWPLRVVLCEADMIRLYTAISGSRCTWEGCDVRDTDLSSLGSP